jgi:hypothetical protein
LESAASEAETGVTGNALGPEETAPVPLHSFPTYRHYKPKNVGMVVVKGHTHYLGRYNSPARREHNHRLIADFHVGRHMRPGGTVDPVNGDSYGVNELILAL